MSSTTKIEILFATADPLPRDSLSSLRFGVASGRRQSEGETDGQRREYAAHRRRRAIVASPQHARGELSSWGPKSRRICPARYGTRMLICTACKAGLLITVVSVSREAALRRNHAEKVDAIGLRRTL